MRGLLVALAFLLAGASSAADPKARATAQLGREAGILDALDALDREIDQVARAQEEGRLRLAELEREAKALDARLAELEGQAKDRRAHLRRRLQAHAGLDASAHLRLLLGARDVAELVRFRHDLALVMRHDLDLLRAVREDQARIQAATDEKLKNSAEVEAVQRTLEERRAALETERGTKAEVLARVRAERGLQERLAAERAKRDAALAEQFAAVPLPGGDEMVRQRGRLPRPALGRIVGAFGKRHDPELGTDTFSKGIDIDAPLGAPVRAVFEGEVVYSGWYKGFGNVVIVRHPGDWYTLYAHLSAVSRGRGDEVGQGDLVGEVGDTGSLRGPMLYFELRRRSEAMDPTPWLRSGQ
jgi:murein DD-endopeptidase MepM/ murein hydrolase activator NlpD